MTRSRYLAIRPFTDQTGFPGQRYAIERLKSSDIIELRIEATLPERVGSDAARRVKLLDSMFFNRAEAAWLYERLGELLT